MESYLLAFISALVISLAVLPVMIRLAPRIGLIDRPDARKVHATPVPRVGGWGIVIGTIVALAIWMPMDRMISAFAMGAFILFLFGMWDDRSELGHYTKFLGQVLAVGIMVFYGDLYISRFPFLDSELPPSVGIPFTVFALVGMINAINHSDGLDGLAGGESTLSLIAMAYLALLAQGDVPLTIAMAVLGGLLGFLRYNTFPATVFMGDGGSQVLGYTLGVLAVVLTQELDPSLSPAVVLLLLGLPIADILFVLYRRIREGNNWFRATKNHVHHRLLERGFVHQESVVIIYSIQGVSVLGGLWLREHSDWMIVMTYLAGCLGIFVLLHIAEVRNWKVRPAKNPVLRKLSGLKHNRRAVVAPRRFLEVAIPVYLVFESASASTIDMGIGVIGAVLFGLLLLTNILVGRRRSLAGRALIYTVCSLVVYLSISGPPVTNGWLRTSEIAFFVLLAAGIAISIRTCPARRQNEFRTTAMDYLMVLVLWIALNLTPHPFAPLEAMVFKLVVLLYACELLIVERRERWQRLGIPSMAAAGIIAIRGLI